MNKQKIYLLSIILAAVTFYTYTFMPRKFEIEGGSCYQGITAMIIRFFLEICVILNLAAIILLLKSKINTPKTLSIISVAIWFLISLLNSVDTTSEDFIIGMKYFTPFLIVNIVIILTINKIKRPLLARASRS
jgi:hypothetical protein